MGEIADRKREIALLKNAMESAENGAGRTVFISGEVGMGKSALCDLISEKAGERGFQVLRGWCYPEYLKPYLPVENALKPLNISHLFQSLSPPRIERLFLIAKSGILLKSVGKEDGMDGDIFTGMLTAVGHFVRDSMQMLGGDEGSLDVLGYGSMRILIERGELCSIAAVISGKENEYLIGDLQRALEEIHERYGDVLREWDSDMDKIAGTEEILGEIVESGKYEGIDYSEEDPKLRKGSIMDNVTLALRRHSRSHPILLIVEDLQWADSSTLSLLHYLSRNIRDSRILLIGTYRPEDVPEGSALLNTISLMMSESLLDTISLGPIDEGELMEFLIKRMGKARESMARKICEESGGNPLFATEMLNSVLESGTEEGIPEMPRRMRDIVLGKIQRLSEEEREMAEAAAVFGEDFNPDILSKMLDRKKIEVIKAMKRMKKMGIFQEKEGKYRFRTPKIREILYEEMGEDLAGAYHELAAQCLEESGADSSTLGYHYFMAGIYDKAIPHLLSAAEEAMKKYSNEEAERLLGYVLRATEDGRWEQERAKALENLGEIYMRYGRFPEAIEKFQEALDISEEGSGRLMGRMAEAYQQMGEYEKALETVKNAEKIADISEKGRLMILEGSILYRKGEYDHAMEVLERALRFLEEHGNERDMASAIRSIGNIHYARGEYEKAMEYYQRSLSVSGEDLPGKAMSFNNLGVVNVKLGNYDEAAEYFKQALKIRERTGDQWGIAMFLSNLGVVHSESGDYEKAMHYFQRSLKIRERIGDRWGEAMSLNNIGLIHLEKGEYRKAVEHFERALEIRRSIGDRDGMAVSMNTLGMAYTELGDLEKALEMYEEALKIEEELGDKGGVAEILAGMGKIHGLRGEYDMALEYLKRSTEISLETEDRRMRGYALCCIAEMEMERGGDTDISELESLVESLNSMEMRGWYLRIKGIHMGLHGDVESAIENLKKALEIFEKMGREGDVGKTLYWLGVVDGKKEHVKKALEIFEKLGMKIWERRAKEFMGGTGS